MQDFEEEAGMTTEAKGEQSRRSDFMAVTKGVPARLVARAMNNVTKGIDWRGVGKKQMADAFAGGPVFGRFCRGVTLESFQSALAEATGAKTP